MTWEIVAQLIITQGLPLAEQLVKLWETGGAPTTMDFVALRASAQQTAKDRLIAQLTKAGIALDTPQAIALIAAAG